MTFILYPLPKKEQRELLELALAATDFQGSLKGFT